MDVWAKIVETEIVVYSTAAAPNQLILLLCWAVIAKSTW